MNRLILAVSAACVACAAPVFAQRVEPRPRKRSSLQRALQAPRSRRTSSTSIVRHPRRQPLPVPHNQRAADAVIGNARCRRTLIPETSTRRRTDLQATRLSLRPPFARRKDPHQRFEKAREPQTSKHKRASKKTESPRIGGLSSFFSQPSPIATSGIGSGYPNLTSDCGTGRQTTTSELKRSSSPRIPS